jgi:hypothetical protein
MTLRHQKLEALIPDRWTEEDEARRKRHTANSFNTRIRSGGAQLLGKPI